MTRDREASDAPQIETDDEFTPQQAQEAAAKAGSNEERVKEAIGHMMASGPDAEANYRATLQSLASGAEEAVAAVADLYRATAEDQYVNRWAQVQLLSDLGEKAALSVFEEILSTPIPPEKAPDMITYSTVGEEVMIRTTAIDGVTRFATQKNRQALELLRKHAQSEIFSIKRAAVQSYLKVAGPNAREELRKILPEQDHFILDIRPTDVQDVPQPQIDRPSDGEDEVPPARILRPIVQE